MGTREFQGKTAVVTGGTRGIGRAISLALAERGADVIALYARDRAHAESLEREAAKLDGKIRTIRGDLTDEETFGKIVAEIESAAAKIDFLVHSAASGVHKKASELTPRHMKWTFDINVFAFHSLLRALLPRIPEGGRVLAVTSSGGTRVIPFYAAVGSSKGALESLMRHYASELAARGIAVNILCPGLVLTDAVESFPDKETRVGAATRATPTKRLTTPEDVAALAVFLCSPQAGQIVGQTIVIDGGKTLAS